MYVKKKSLSKEQIKIICDFYYVNKCKNCPLNISNTNLCLADLQNVDLDKVKVKLNEFVSMKRYYN